MDLKPEKEKRLAGKRFRAIRDKRVIPAELVDLVEKVLEIQLEAKKDAFLPDLTVVKDGANQRVLQGAPLVAREEFPYDEKLARDVFGKLLAVLKECDSHQAQAAVVLEEAEEKDELDLKEAFRAYVTMNNEYFEAWAEKTPSAPMALHFLVHSALAPTLESAGIALSKMVPSDFSSTHGQCPVCGSLPFMSNLRGDGGARHHVCSFCHVSYRTKRTGCFVCGEEDFNKLAYYHADGEPGFRLDVCNSCKTYMKTTDFRELDRKSMPLLDDLESAPLDILANEMGYSRATMSGLGF